MSQQKPLVSFVVLTWNTLDETLVCLESIRKQTYPNYEIIVIDNGSPADQKQVLRTIKDITFIDFPTNTGFTGGQIAGAKVAKGAYLALVNNDSVIAPDWCDLAVQAITSKPRIGVVGGRAYDWNDSLKLKAFDTTNSFYSYQVVNRSNGHTSTLRTGEIEMSVSSISGAAVLINTKAIEGVGYFDDRFFAYYEETDLFARMKRAGWQILYEPQLHVWHKIAQSTSGKPGFYLYHMHRNRFMFAVKNFDGRFLWTFLGAYTKEWIRSILGLLRHGSKTVLEQRMRAKAGWWNLLHAPVTFWRRHQVRQLGPDYSKLLETDALEDVTVIVPCYNYAAYVEETLTSIVQQTVLPSEVIIIDDGSTDNSLEVIQKSVKRLARSYPQIVFTVLNQKNKGVVATKNRGLELARSQWTIFLDADDTLNKQYVQKCITAQRAHNADVVYTDMQMFGAIDAIQTVLPYNKYRLRSVNFIHNSSLFRTSLLRQVGGYNEQMNLGFEDWELNLKLSKLTDKFYYLPEPLLNYRRHEGASRDNNAQQKLTLVTRLIEQLHPELFDLRYCWWFETNRLLASLKIVTAYPFRMAKHTYYHSIMGLDRRARNSRSLRRVATGLRTIKNRGKKA